MRQPNAFTNIENACNWCIFNLFLIPSPAINRATPRSAQQLHCFVVIFKMLIRIEIKCVSIPQKRSSVHPSIRPSVYSYLVFEPWLNIMPKIKDIHIAMYMAYTICDPGKQDGSSTHSLIQNECIILIMDIKRLSAHWDDAMTYLIQDVPRSSCSTHLGHWPIWR